MSDGLITRIGKWWDSKFEDKASAAQLEDYRGFCIETHNAFGKALDEIRASIKALGEETKSEGLNKDVADLTTRIEKLELGTGMYRKIDPTKAPVAKTAFQM
jgi:hypothetical protein